MCQPQQDWIGLEKLTERANLIKSNPEFVEKCKKAINEIAEEKKLKYKSKEDELTANDPHNQFVRLGDGRVERQEEDDEETLNTIYWEKVEVSWIDSYTNDIILDETVYSVLYKNNTTGWE